MVQRASKTVSSTAAPAVPNGPPPLATVLLVEDEPDFAESVTRVLRAAGYEVKAVSSVAEAEASLRRCDPDVVLSDVHLPDGNGMDLLKAVLVRDPLRPIILMTGSGSVDLAVEATLHGAFDYLLKPVERTQLLEAIEKAAASRAMSKQVVSLPTRARKDDSPIVGSSPAMLRLFKEVGRVARQPVPILLLGETGTGKELIARALYRYSGLKNKPFVPVNCAAIPETLLESELFGHEKGAFTGAQARRIGRFQQAHGGMIFLDEIGEIPLPMQAKLLRVLQEKEIQPVGSSGAPVKIDVRIVAATHRNLEREVAAGRFREDLYFRINIAPLYLPPVRERREDIPDLVGYFLRRQSEESGKPVLRVDPDALAWLRQRPWPGNVRELENTVKRAALFTHGGVLGLDALRDAVKRNPHPAPTLQPEQDAEHPVSRSANTAADGGVNLDFLVDSLLDRHLTKPKGKGEEPPPSLLAEVEREVILRILRRVENNKTRAAEILGINRKTLREKLTQHGLAGEAAEVG